MEPEKRREYKRCFQFVPGPELPTTCEQEIEIDPSEDFALMALRISSSESARIEDFRMILYNSALEVEMEKGRKLQIPLMDLPSAPPPVPTQGIALEHFSAEETVKLRIIFDPERPTAKRVSALVEITIHLLGWDRPKPKPRRRRPARRKRATQ